MELSTTVLNLSHQLQLEKMDKISSQLKSPIIPRKDGRRDEAKEAMRRRDEDEHGNQVCRKVSIPSHYMGFAAGRNYANQERLEKEYGVGVLLPRGRVGCEIELNGRADMVHNARIDILESLPVEWIFPVEDETFAIIIGYRGTTIRDLRKNHNVTIDFDFDEREVIISGVRKRCEEAWEEISRLIESELLQK